MSAREHVRAIVYGMEASRGNFLATLRQFGGLTEGEAQTVFAYYREHRLIKWDRINATYAVKHGALLDRDCLREALVLATT